MSTEDVEMGGTNETAVAKVEPRADSKPTPKTDLKAGAKAVESRPGKPNNPSSKTDGQKKNATDKSSSRNASESQGQSSSAAPPAPPTGQPPGPSAGPPNTHNLTRAELKLKNDRRAVNNLLKHPSIDYYGLLDIPQTTSGDEIGKIRRRWNAVVHPDKNQDEWAREVTTRVNRACDVLSDPVLRAEYDQNYENTMKQLANYETSEEHMHWSAFTIDEEADDEEDAPLPEEVPVSDVHREIYRNNLPIIQMLIFQPDDTPNRQNVEALNKHITELDNGYGGNAVDITALTNYGKRCLTGIEDLKHGRDVEKTKDRLLAEYLGVRLAASKRQLPPELLDAVKDALTQWDIDIPPLDSSAQPSFTTNAQKTEKALSRMPLVSDCLGKCKAGSGWHYIIYMDNTMTYWTGSSLTADFGKTGTIKDFTGHGRDYKKATHKVRKVLDVAEGAAYRSRGYVYYENEAGSNMVISRSYFLKNVEDAQYRLDEHGDSIPNDQKLLMYSASKRAQHNRLGRQKSLAGSMANLRLGGATNLPPQSAFQPGGGVAVY